MLAIPYLAADGHPVSMRFRRADWALPQAGSVQTGDTIKTRLEGPKYLGFPEEPTRVYNVAALMKPGDTIGVAEGEFDALILDKVLGAGVGYPGVSSWKKHHSKLFEGYGKVYVFGDGDEAGRGFVTAMTNRLRNAVPIYMPEGRDVTDVFLERGVEGVEGLIA